ncbi:hypothetical protein MLD83_004495 [Salmonella enterica]|nr:hypothetical protein [Salmonella enterica]EIY0703455.1 hypothetical protein [Salmonella enterica]EIZ8885924.1 hypothetical protein [Salmonella enterica]EIZ8948686.1 hypothetical protein [Salmonella enterica]EIZ9037325.1 hypothetical protein [Salmonella enterica]
MKPSEAQVTPCSMPSHACARNAGKPAPPLPAGPLVLGPLLGLLGGLLHPSV